MSSLEIDDRLVSYITCDSKIYRFRYSEIQKWPSSIIKAYATIYIKKDMELLLVDGHIYLDDHSSMIDKFFKDMLYSHFEGNIYARLCDKLCVDYVNDSEKLNKMFEFVNATLKKNNFVVKNMEAFNKTLISYLQLFPIKMNINRITSSNKYNVACLCNNIKTTGYDHFIVIGMNKEKEHGIFIVYDMCKEHDYVKADYDEYYPSLNGKRTMYSKFQKDDYKLIIIE